MSTETEHPSFEELSRAHAQRDPSAHAAHRQECARCKGAWADLDAMREAARALPWTAPVADHMDARSAELVELALLATRAKRQRRRALSIAGSVALAASVAVAWIATRSGSSESSEPTAVMVAVHASVQAAEGAQVEHFTRSASSPGARTEEVVRVSRGAATIHVAPLADDERLLVLAGTDTLDVRAESFFVRVEGDRLEEVRVDRGTVMVQPESGAPILLRTGERWTRARDRDDPPAPRAANRAPEAWFEAGWSALEAGRFEQAATQLERLVQEAPEHALAEDAAYWVAVARGRAGDAARAVRAFERFLTRYADSQRAGEAAAMLGWLQLESANLSEAQAWFAKALDDRDEAVRESAARGMAELRARR